MKIIKLLILIIAIISSASSLAIDKNIVNFDTFTLNNGLLVVVVPNHRAPVIHHALFYKVGSADSPYNQSGIAHFLEHLMFKGTKKFPKDHYKRTINKLGGLQNASTSWDRTQYYVTIAKEYLPTVMELEADRMKNLILDKDEFEKERNVVLQERNQTIDAIPEGRLNEATNATFFWHHPYGKPVIGFKEHIEKYSMKNVMDFYNKWYAPNNAILVIAGDTTLNEIKPLVQKHYGNIKKGTLPKRTRAKEPNHNNTTATATIRDTQLKSMSFRRLYQAPNHRTIGAEKEDSITLLAHILGNDTNSRLHKSLVEQQKIAYYVNAGYVGYLIDPYSFIISAIPMNAIDFTLLEASVESEIKRLIAEGVTEKELALAKKEYSLQLRYENDSLINLASFIGENLAHEYSIEEVKNSMAKIETVSVNDINKFAKEILDKPANVVSYSYPIIKN